MFRLYLEYARLISPDRDNGKMVSSRVIVSTPARLLASSYAIVFKAVVEDSLMLVCRTTSLGQSTNPNLNQVPLKLA